MKNKYKKILAVATAFAVAVAGLMIQSETQVKAASFTSGGKTYTIPAGNGTGNLVGFVFNGAETDGLRFSWNGDEGSTLSVAVMSGETTCGETTTVDNGQTIPKSFITGKNLSNGNYSIVFTSSSTTHTQTLSMTVANEVVTSFVEGTELILDRTFQNSGSNWVGGSYSNGVATVNTHDGDASEYASQLKYNGISIESGKWYKAEFTIQSNVDKKVRFLSQVIEQGWAVIKSGDVISLSAGTSTDVRVTFQSTITNDNTLWGIMMGNVDGNDADATITVTNPSLKVYSSEEQLNASISTPVETTTAAPVETTTAAPVETTTPEPVETTTVAPASDTLTSNSIAIQGFQIKTNFPEAARSTDVAFRAIGKCPSVGSTITVSGQNYTVESHGIILTLDPNDDGYRKNDEYTKADTLLDFDHPVEGKAWSYIGSSVGNSTKAYISTNKALVAGLNNRNDGNDYYVFTISGINTYITHTFHVRAFAIVTKDENRYIVYGEKAAATSVPQIADNIYRNNKSSNIQGHQYLFDFLSNALVANLIPTTNPYYRTQAIEYGWDGNLHEEETTTKFEGMTFVPAS
ncbi:MAG: hypothetical protein K6G88_04640 [Lachnospiraceae bacterium]|nr:hypothetical protein [Lachnospiraceae bacterium]